MTVEKQVLSIFTGTNGFIDDLPVPSVRKFEDYLHRFVENSYPTILPTIRDKKNIDDALKAEMGKAIEEAKKRFLAENKA